MVELLIFIFVVSTALAVFPALQLAMRKLAYPEGKRHMHIRYMMVILLLEIFVFSFLLSPWLIRVMYRFITLDGVERVVDYLLPDYGNNLSYIMLSTILLNILMQLCTVLLCGAVRWLFPRKSYCFRRREEYRAVEFPLRWVNKLVCLFFDSSDGERSTLNSAGHYVGKWAGSIKWCFAALGALEVIITTGVIFFGTNVHDAFLELSISWYLLPVGGFLLADQIHAALSSKAGFAFTSFEVSRPVEQISARLEDHVNTFLSTYGHTGALLHTVKLTATKQDKKSITDDPGNQQLADCEHGELLAALCDRIDACAQEEQSEHYQRALADLLDGKHVNVCDQPEGEFVIYLTAYLSYVMSLGRTAVLLCKNSRDGERFKALLSESLYRLNNINRIWRICTAREANCDAPLNLLICSYDELVKLRLLEVRHEFAAALQCVVVAHGEHLFARDTLAIHQLFNQLQTYSGKVQYVLLSETDNDSLRTAMESYMGSGELLPFDNARCKNRTHVMLWQEESCFKLQSQIGIGDSAAPYMGAAIPLALVSAKCDTPMTFIIPAQDRPDDTYRQYMCSSTRDVAGYLTNHADAATVIRCDPGEALKPQQLKQLICYDTRYDFVNAVLGWTQYAGSAGTVLHIVSPNYLLREYFVSKLQSGHGTLPDHPAEALFPRRCVSEKSKPAALLVELWNRGMTETELLRKSKEYGWPCQTPEALLKKCLEAVLPTEASINVFETFSFEQRKRQLQEDGSLTGETLIRLVDSDVYDRIMAMTCPAVAQIGTDHRVELPIPAGDITNYYLREQQLALEGLCYKIVDISRDTVFLTQCSDPYAYEYFPVSQFDFRDYKTVDQCMDGSLLNVNIAVAKARRQIHGYWRSNCGYRIEGDGIFTLEQLDHCTEEKTVSVLEITLLQTGDSENQRRLSATLAFILNDLFKTLFPYNHQNLFAVVRGEDAFVQSIHDGAATETTVKSLIPFTLSQAPENGTAATVYIVEFSCLEYGMVELLYLNRDRILRTVQRYLDWYVNAETLPDGTKGGTALRFGGSSIPAVLWPEGLLALLNEILDGESSEEPPVTGPVFPEPEYAEICTFCGRKAGVVHRYEDGRRICNICRNHQIKDQSELPRLLEQVQQLMEEEYDIRLPRNIHICFKNADELRHETNSPRDERRLGFYDWRENRLLLESGSPRVPVCGMMVHELTRAWQHTNLPMPTLKKLPAFRKNSRLNQLLEAHASLVEVQTMRKLHEETYADRQEQLLMDRQDGYGKAYRLIRKLFDNRVRENVFENAATFMKWLASELIGREGSLDWNNEKIT